MQVMPPTAVPAPGAMPAAGPPAEIATAPAPSPASADVHEVRPGEPLPAPGAGADIPAYEFVREHGKALLAIPGVYSVSWSMRDTSEVRLYFTDEHMAGLATGVLEPEVDGISLVPAMHPAREPYAGGPRGTASEQVRLLAAMPGVWDFRYSIPGRYSNGVVYLDTVSQAHVDALDPLIKNRIPFGLRDDGYMRHMAVRFNVRLP